MSGIRTRFAPSPTGYLHIGGVRTALFNWLLTRRLGGQFILRIDDTDAGRNRPEALQPILDGFRWLGINWDEGPEVGGNYGPYFQSQRNQLYVDAAMRLLDTGRAYPCYLSKDELDAERKQAEQKKISYVHRGKRRDTPAADNVRDYKAKPVPLRLKVPAGTSVKIHDLIRGDVEWQTDTIGDPVILRPPGADGIARPLYNFATVVDDVAMKITHVVRAAEHLSNTPVQVLVYQAMSASLPEFAHVPAVNAPNSKDKLSKRKMQQFMTPQVIAQLRACHVFPPDWTDEQIKKQENINPATVAFYRELGYLPTALVNYLGRLGWSLDDKTEIIALPDMIAKFSLDRVNNSPASFDPEKLLWLAGEYMRTLPLAEKAAGVLPFLQRAGLVGAEPDAATKHKIERVAEACGERLKIFSDALLYGAFFFRDPEYDPAAVEKRLRKPGAAEILRDVAGILKTIEPFDAKTLETQLQAVCQAKNIKPGDLNHILRVATTGVTIGPGVFECLAILGRDETLRRIDMALKLV